MNSTPLIKLDIVNWIIYKPLNPTARYTVFSNTCGTFTKIDLIHETYPNKLKRMVIQCSQNTMGLNKKSMKEK